MQNIWTVLLLTVFRVKNIRKPKALSSIYLMRSDDNRIYPTTQWIVNPGKAQHRIKLLQQQLIKHSTSFHFTIIIIFSSLTFL